MQGLLRGPSSPRPGPGSAVADQRSRSERPSVRALRQRGAYPKFERRAWRRIVDRVGRKHREPDQATPTLAIVLSPDGLEIPATGGRLQCLRLLSGTRVVGWRESIRLYAGVSSKALVVRRPAA